LTQAKIKTAAASDEASVAAVLALAFSTDPGGSVANPVPDATQGAVMSLAGSKLQMSRFELVIFDCDGVLVDSERITNTIFCAMLNELGLPLSLDDMFERFVGLSMPQCTALITEMHGKPPPDTFIPELQQRAGVALKEQITPISGVADVLATLSVPYCVASSGDHEKIRLTLGATGLLKQRTISTQAAGLVGWLGVAFAAAAIGAVASADAGSFYAQLIRPAWAPPASAFGPVWSTLYLLMGIAAWLVWRERDAPRLGAALTLFIAQLCTNALWSWLFFAWRKGALAFMEVLVLLVLIAVTIAAFWRISRLAGLLMFPYFAWVCLASALTWSVWQNNPNLL